VAHVKPTVPPTILAARTSAILADGYILACQAVSLSASVSIAY
jgi:hypothetical protein